MVGFACVPSYKRSTHLVIVQAAPSERLAPSGADFEPTLFSTIAALSFFLTPNIGTILDFLYNLCRRALMKKFITCLMVLLVSATLAFAADDEREVDRVKDAGQVLKEILNIP